MNKAGNIGFGSVLFGLIRTIFKPLTNEKGEVGEDGTNPGEDALEMDTGDQELNLKPENQPIEEDQPEGDNPPSAETLNTEEGTQPEGDQLTPADTAFHKSPRFQEMNTSLNEMRTQVEQLQAQVEQSNQMAQFYQQQFNEAQNYQPLAGQPAVQPGKQPGSQEQPGVLPEGLVGPGEWADQEQEGKWVEHTVNTVAEHKAAEVMNNAYQHTFMPLITQITNAISGLQLSAAKAGKDDFDEVMDEVNKELFNIGPDEKVYGILDQARLNYFKSQPNPYAAMYKYGLTKKTPQKIRDGIQKQTKAAIQQIGKRPSAPVQPAGGDAPGEVAELEWDTPSAVAEKILNKKGLI